jgi:hypothetical protein
MIPTRRPTRKPTPTAKAAALPPPGMGRIYQTPEIRVDGVTVAPAGQAAVDDAALAIVRAMPKDHFGIVKHVIRDPDGKITSVIEENATIRTVQ